MVKILQGGLKSQQIQPESNLGSLKRVGIGTGISALQGLENLFGLIPTGLQALGAKPVGFGGQEPQRFSELLKQQYELTPEYLQPQNLPENILQKFAGKAPVASLFGPASLATSALGSIVGAGLQQAGAPELLQDISELGSEIGAGYKLGKFLTPGQAQKIAYQQTKLAIPKGKIVQAQPLINALTDVEKKLGTEVSKEVSNKIKNALRVTTDNLSKDKLSPAKALELRKNLYNLSGELDKSKAAEYIQPLTKSINDFFAGYAAENPQFYKHLKHADKLTELRNMRTIVDRFFDTFKLDKLAGIGPASRAILGSTIGSTEKFIRSISTNPAARKYYFDSVSAAVKQDPNLFLKNINKLNKHIKPSESNIKIIKGGKK